MKIISINIPNKIKPLWAANILSCFDTCLKEIPQYLIELQNILQNPIHWHKSNTVISEIKNCKQKLEYKSLPNFFCFVEKAAQLLIMLNEKKIEQAENICFKIPELALKATHDFGEDHYRLEDKVYTAIVILDFNKEFSKNIIKPEDFILYKNIHEILWTDWDPIGINHLAPEKEYLTYVPIFYKLKRENADSVAIMNALMKIEQEKMGGDCSGGFTSLTHEEIADKIIKL